VRWEPAAAAASVSCPWSACTVLITDGSYLKTKEPVGGLWVLEAADLDQAVAWGKKATIACRVPVEVRPFH